MVARLSAQEQAAVDVVCDFGLALPEERGGTRVSVPCHAMVTEEPVRGWMSPAGAMGGHTVAAELLLAFGTDVRRARCLPGMVTGAMRAATALTEPAGGSDLQAMATTARNVVVRQRIGRDGVQALTAPRGRVEAAACPRVQPPATSGSR